MTKQTSANMKPCRGGAAERHNRREKDLDYVRKDLTHLNISKEWTPITNQMKKIRIEYEKATKQKLQPSSQPIQEIVLVIDKDTGPVEVERFCELIKELGMTPLSYAIHKDEGHKDSETGEWIPNYHAHIIVDTTCWEHKTVLRTKKNNGKNVIDPVTKKPVKIKVDAYAKTIKFTREDMSRLQDYAAEATGLERGVASGRIHEEARQFKAREQAREIELQINMIAEKKAIIEQQSSIINTQNNLIATQSSTIDEQKRMIAEQERGMRESIADMQRQGKEVVKNFDEQNERISSWGIVPDKKLKSRRDFLEKISDEDLSKAPVSRILKILKPLSDAIMVVAMAAAAISNTIASSLAKTLEEKEKMLAALMRQIKEQSYWKSAKGAILSFLNRPATRQAKLLAEEAASSKEECKNKSKKISELENTVADLRKDNTDKTKSITAYENYVERSTNEMSSLDSQIKEICSQMRVKDNTLRNWKDNFKKIAEDLVDHASPELLQRYESRGLPRFIGEEIWKHAKYTKEQREVERLLKQKSESKGIHM